MNRPTPETDAAWSCFKGYMEPLQDVKDLSRKLERERDEARGALKHIEEYGTEEINAAVELRQKLAQALVDLDNLQDQRDLAMKVIKRLEQERDEAREKAERYRLEANAMMMQRDEWASMCGRYKQERDEAREEIEEEKRFHHRTHAELIQTQGRLMDMTQAIILTLEENRHLADGDDCTLAKLKSAVSDWK